MGGFALRMLDILRFFDSQPNELPGQGLKAGGLVAVHDVGFAASGEDLFDEGEEQRVELRAGRPHEHAVLQGDEEALGRFDRGHALPFDRFDRRGKNPRVLLISHVVSACLPTEGWGPPTGLREPQTG